MFYNAQYSMIEHYLNDVVVKELISRGSHAVRSTKNKKKPVGYTNQVLVHSVKQFKDLI